MFCQKFIAGTGAPVAALANGTQFWGFTASNAEGATIFLKLWWQGNTNTAPVVGTTAATVTLAIPSAGQPIATSIEPIIQQGPLYYAVTKNAADTDTTALSTGGDVITLFLG